MSDTTEERKELLREGKHEEHNAQKKGTSEGRKKSTAAQKKGRNF